MSLSTQPNLAIGLPTVYDATIHGVYRNRSLLVIAMLQLQGNEKVPDT